VTKRGPEVQILDTVTPPTPHHPLLLSCGAAVCQLDNGQVSHHEVSAVQVHDPEAEGYDAEAHTRCVSLVTVGLHCYSQLVRALVLQKGVTNAT
jgi:hypothetical protein